MHTIVQLYVPDNWICMAFQLGCTKIQAVSNDLMTVPSWQQHQNKRKFPQTDWMLFSGKVVLSVGSSREKEVQAFFLVITFAFPGSSPKWMCIRFLRQFQSYSSKVFCMEQRDVNKHFTNKSSFFSQILYLSIPHGLRYLKHLSTSVVSQDLKTPFDARLSTAFVKNS